MKRFVAAMTVSLALFGPGLAKAKEHTGLQPSQYCDGSTPATTPVEMAQDAQPGICFQMGGGIKGAVWYDPGSNSIVVDGDQTNGNSSRCFDGYAGVEARDGSHAQLLYSPGGNYDPNAPVSDGGANGSAAGSAHDQFDPTTEAGELSTCFIG